MFTVENMKQVGALKAIGVTNGRLVTMVLLWEVVVGVVATLSVRKVLVLEPASVFR